MVSSELVLGSVSRLPPTAARASSTGELAIHVGPQTDYRAIWDEGYGIRNITGRRPTFTNSTYHIKGSLVYSYSTRQRIKRVEFETGRR